MRKQRSGGFKTVVPTPLLPHSPESPLKLSLLTNLLLFHSAQAPASTAIAGELPCAWRSCTHPSLRGVPKTMTGIKLQGAVEPAAKHRCEASLVSLAWAQGDVPAGNIF